MDVENTENNKHYTLIGKYVSIVLIRLVPISLQRNEDRYVKGEPIHGQFYNTLMIPIAVTHCREVR